MPGPDYDDIPTKFWGAARISHRAFDPTKDKVVIPDGEGTALTHDYTYAMPKAGGKNVVLYIIENGVKLGISLKKALGDKAQECFGEASKKRTASYRAEGLGDLKNMKHLKDLKDLQDSAFYSSKDLKAFMVKNNVEGSISSPSLDVGEERLEVIWPMYKDGDAYNCPDFKPSDEESPEKPWPWELHGTMTTNIAAGETFGAAPKARVVLVHKVPATNGPTTTEGGIGLVYQAILEHYRSLDPKLLDPKSVESMPRAVLSISQGSQALTVQFNIDSYHLLDELVDAGICIVSAAGNRGDGSKETIVTQLDERNFISDIVNFPKAQRRYAQNVLDTVALFVQTTLNAKSDAINKTTPDIRTCLNGLLEAASKPALYKSALDESIARTKENLLSKVVARVKEAVAKALALSLTVRDALLAAIESDKSGQAKAFVEELKSLADTLDDVNRPLARLYGMAALKLPAVHPKVLSVGGLRPDDTICTEYYYGSAIDVYAPAVNIPWLEKEKKIFDKCWKDETASETDRQRLKTVTGTSYATPLVAGAIACLLSETLKIQPVDAKSKVQRFGQDPHVSLKDQVKDLARKVKIGSDNYNVFCIAPLNEQDHGST